MIINHNMNAMNAHRNMLMNTVNGGKSMEKLSSGLRVNRAGDDAAGLAISEKMRAQIRGLDQASTNSQDGISLIQTAEGALGETHSILQRMRELATQAANDTNVDVDRKEIQKEINQLTSEVNRIGNTTEFNTKKLLSSSTSKEVKDNVMKGLKEGWLEVSEKLIEKHYGLTGNDAGGTKTKINVVLGSQAEYGTLAYVRPTPGNFELFVDMEDFKKGDGEDGNNIHGKLFNDRIIAHEMTHAVMADSLGSKFGSSPTWFIEGTAEFIAGADERLKGAIGNGTGTAIDTTKRDELISRASALLGGAKWDGTNDDYAAGYLIVKYASSKLNTANDMKSLMTAIKNDGSTNGTTAINNALGTVGTANTISSIGNLKTSFDTNAATFVGGLSFDWGSAETDVGAIGGINAGGASAVNAEAVVDESKATDKTDGQPLTHFDVVWPSDDAGSSEVLLQIGANQGQSFSLQLKDMRASALKISGEAGKTVTSKDGTVTAKYTKIDGNEGVTDGSSSKVVEYALDLSTRENASAAIKVINDAIENVSSFRSELGAAQNRLEHTIANLGTSSENLTAAESRVRDVDMAKEMMNFSKNNILSQASQAMIAQAKSQPEAVLQLLR